MLPLAGWEGFFTEKDRSANKLKQKREKELKSWLHVSLFLLLIFKAYSLFFVSITILTGHHSIAPLSFSSEYSGKNFFTEIIIKLFCSPFFFIKRNSYLRLTGFDIRRTIPFFVDACNVKLAYQKNIAVLSFTEHSSHRIIIKNAKVDDLAA